MKYSHLCALFCLPVLSIKPLDSVSQADLEKNQTDLEADQGKPLISAKPHENSALELITKNPFVTISKHFVIGAALLYGLYLIPQARPFLLQAGSVIVMTSPYSPVLMIACSFIFLPKLTAAALEILQPLRKAWNETQNKAQSKFGDLVKQTHVTEDLLAYEDDNVNELLNELVERSNAKNGDCILTVAYGEPGTGKTALTKHLAETIRAYYGLEEAGADSFFMSSGITTNLYHIATQKIIDALQQDNVVFTLDDVFCGERNSAPGILGKDTGEKTSSVLTFYNMLTEEIKRRKDNGEKLYNAFLFVTSNAIYDDPQHKRYMKMDPALARRADYIIRINPLSSDQISNAVLRNLLKIHTKHPHDELKKFVTELISGTSLDIGSIQRILKRVYEAEADYNSFKTKATEMIQRKTDVVKQVT